MGRSISRLAGPGLQRSRNVIQQPAAGKRFTVGPELQSDGVRGAIRIAHENAAVGSQVLDGPGRTRRARRPDVDGLAAGPTETFHDRRDDLRRCQATVAGNDRRRIDRIRSCLGQVANLPANSIAILRATLGLKSLIATLPTPSA